MLVLLVSVLAFLLASFPARNSDLWMHLANGRLLAHGELSSGTDLRDPPGSQVNRSWLYDLLGYGLYSVVAGEGDSGLRLDLAKGSLVLCKALLVVGLALVLLRLSRAGPRWWLPVFCTMLALLAMGTRLLLQPVTVSYLFLALALWFVRDREPRLLGGWGVHRRTTQPPNNPNTEPPSRLPPWPLFVLFVVWVNVDSWFVLGLGTVALVWLGQVLDEAFGAARPQGAWRVSLLHRGLCFALLAAACLLNPAHVHAFALPPELGWFPYWDYLTRVKLNVAGLAYVPLLGLGLLSFALDLRGWRWQRFLPWLALAVLSALQVRTVPFFAVVAGPVLAWNLQEFFARGFETGRWQTPAWRRTILEGRVLTAVLVLILPVCAWPGWLQLPPFEPRQWAVETPPSLEKGAATTSRWLREEKFGPQPRGLHLSAETAHAFAWFCPEAKGLRDDRLAGAVRGEQDGDAEARAGWNERMRAAGINHVILYDPDPGRLCATMNRLLEDPQQWPLLYVEGYLAVFGWRDPVRSTARAADPFRGQQLDLNYLAFHPPEDKKAPPKPSDREPEERQWWEAFWKPTPRRPINQDEANLHLFHADALRKSAPGRHQLAWESRQAAALVGAAGGWAGPVGLLDAGLRLTLLRPQSPKRGRRFDTLPGLDQLAQGLRQQFALERDDTPPALLYLAVRAARRALAVNPNDAQAYLVLGESYLMLLHSTRERVWGAPSHLPKLAELRRAQASAALNQAVALKPDYAQAHLSLYKLYAEMGYLDLTLEHLRTYLKLIQEAGPPAGVSAEQFHEQEVASEEELSLLAKEVENRTIRYAVTSAGWKVVDRAFEAWRLGLAGKARDLLLESNIAAFGPRGMELELELLLRTGRPKDVWKWSGELSSEDKAKLGMSYSWLRAEALAASGDYALAREECTLLSQSLASGPRGQAVQFREVIALAVGQAVLDEQPVGKSVASLLWRAYSPGFGRLAFTSRVMGLGQSLRLEANVTVLRGLFTLEEGDADEAEIAFREALVLWKDAAAAASGSGLDFEGRALAQGCLELLEKKDGG
jgi:tetratricopeptide (TPR) repeat protein